MSRIILRRKMAVDVLPQAPKKTSFERLKLYAYFTIPGPFGGDRVFQKFKNQWSQDISGYWNRVDNLRAVIEVIRPVDWPRENPEGIDPFNP